MKQGWALLFFAALAAAEATDDKCIPIKVELCSDVLYNTTILPNIFGHTSFDKVMEDLAHYAPLIRTDCSKQTKFFICSLFVPMCSTTLQAPVTACKSVCESVQRDCIDTLTNFGFKWPEQLNCSQFPDQNKGAVCMHQPDESVLQGQTDFARLPPPPPPPTTPQRDCAAELVKLSASRHNHPLKCAPICHRHHSFAASHKAFAEIWMAVWAGLCALVTLCTVLTCVLDNVRFRFPERSIIYLALCYFAISLAYLVRLGLGAEASSCARLATGESYLVSGGLDNVTCVVLFMVLYYFWIASQMWWVVLSGAWFLAARKKWSVEAIEGWGSYFHLVAWGIPAILSILILIGRLVDASELTGLCLVGNSDPDALLALVIAPLAITLLLGILHFIPP